MSLSPSSDAAALEAVVTVYPRPGILDPQGKAISQALERLDFDGVTAVRAGKVFTIGLEERDPEAARQAVVRMCETLLANTVVEDYEVTIRAVVSGEGES
ncbi:MAG: phosphoribosylformylglycinamidine synthase subunit PurS [Acidobacteriota bacterium]